MASKSVQKKTKLMNNSTNGINTQIKIGEQNLETVDSFKYLGAIVSEEGSKPEIMSRIAQTTASLKRLKTIWRDRNLALSIKIRLMRSLVLSIFLYACESWTLTAELEKKVNTTEMRCFRNLLGISYQDHISNEQIRTMIRQEIGHYDDLLATVKKRKLE